MTTVELFALNLMEHVNNDGNCRYCLAPLTVPREHHKDCPIHKARKIVTNYYITASKERKFVDRIDLLAQEGVL